MCQRIAHVVLFAVSVRAVFVVATLIDKSTKLRNIYRCRRFVCLLSLSFVVNLTINGRLCVFSSRLSLRLSLAVGGLS